MVFWTRVGARKGRVYSCSRRNSPFHRSISYCAPRMSTSQSLQTTDQPERVSVSGSASKLVMQIILPRSLVVEDKWPVGPLLAQSAHAATAVLHVHRDLPEVRSYLSNLENMRKTVLEVKDVEALRGICAQLDQMDRKIPYHLWIEQPENTPTALALVPNNRPTALKRILDHHGCVLWK
ncbi:peptidyl-tRNA hydrolase II domain-containing protein [Kockovaella imperatae]|uniref:peptidyl-tRNA hydrolase n=1 Tax=Kockovaella imperatae TaxID=4999 RepID=A0A1Y1UC28_9TREE|nr:peptidyl-tRNA hydrolase II domain-containing protein [Kockovaella imperatae]ORX35593.1 peptidyl-tRNA hydrolase II domain-containing protein [Kockovaella imperatae]